MAALRKQLSSPSKNGHSSSSSSLPPLKGILKKRPRVDSISEDDEGDSESMVWVEPVKRKSAHNPAALVSSPPHSSLPPSKQQHRQHRSYTYTDSGKGKRRALHHDSSIEDFNTHYPVTSKHARFAVEASKCKFAKAGCPFTGPPEEVKTHEDTYCSPLYRQLAYYKMLATRTSTHSPHASTSRLPSTNTTTTLSDDETTPVSHTTSLTEAYSQSTPIPSPSKEVPPDTEVLNERIRRLETDLQRAQSQLAEEKKLRTERLRKASERCLELMSLSELGEGKVEVLRMKVKAERELREKLEEELESMRAEKIAEELLRY